MTAAGALRPGPRLPSGGRALESCRRKREDGHRRMPRAAVARPGRSHGSRRGRVWLRGWPDPTGPVRPDDANRQKRCGCRACIRSPGCQGLLGLPNHPSWDDITPGSIVGSAPRSGRSVDLCRFIRTRRDGIAMVKTRNRAAPLSRANAGAKSPPRGRLTRRGRGWRGRYARRTKSRRRKGVRAGRQPRPIRACRGAEALPGRSWEFASRCGDKLEECRPRVRIPVNGSAPAWRAVIFPPVEIIIMCDPIGGFLILCRQRPADASAFEPGVLDFPAVPPDAGFPVIP